MQLCSAYTIHYIGKFGREEEVDSEGFCPYEAQQGEHLCKYHVDVRERRLEPARIHDTEIIDGETDTVLWSRKPREPRVPPAKDIPLKTDAVKSRPKKVVKSTAKYHYERFTDDEVEQLTEMYMAERPLSSIAAFLDIPLKRVRMKIAHMKKVGTLPK